jgi:hypothetical protein
MSTTLFRREISDYVGSLKEKEKKIKLDNAVDFNSFELKDQHAILRIYEIKACQGELKTPLEDMVAGIEETARLYRAQNCAFQDVLTEKNFEPTQEVLKTYGGRIAILTSHGTLIILGKPKSKGRLITMQRIHSPKFNHDKQRGSLMFDLKLNELPYLDVISTPGYKGSQVRALAVNPYGADDDELEEKDAHETVIMMGRRTAYFLTQPRELVGNGN